MKTHHIAVTGTKGKTTITRLIQESARYKDLKVYGEYGIDGCFFEGRKIGPDFRPADDYFKQKEINKADLVVTEATSYILSIDCLKGHTLDAAIFTGLEEKEHSELYETTEEYIQAKKKISSYLDTKGIFVVNKDSDFFEQITEGFEGKLVTYGFDESSDYVIQNLKTNLSGLSFDLKGPDQTVHKFKSLLWGSYNASNIAASAISCNHVGLSFNDFSKSLTRFPGILGRSNCYHVVETNSLVVIDYAHTPKSLEYQLEFLRSQQGSRRLVCVFGCGGLKSTEKRPEMGRVACSLSDNIILTNDNPRDEHPRQILLDILSGIDDLGCVEVYPDREEAIKRALSDFHNSIILIAGKGSEEFMEVSGCDIMMSDTEILERWIIQNGYGVRGSSEYIL